MCFVDGTASFQIAGRFARIDAIPMDAAFEETRTPVTTVNAIMLARTSISAHFAWYIQKSVAYSNSHREGEGKYLMRIQRNKKQQKVAQKAFTSFWQQSVRVNAYLMAKQIFFYLFNCDKRKLAWIIFPLSKRHVDTSNTHTHKKG